VGAGRFLRSVRLPCRLLLPATGAWRRIARHSDASKRCANERSSRRQHQRDCDNGGIHPAINQRSFSSPAADSSFSRGVPHVQSYHYTSALRKLRVKQNHRSCGSQHISPQSYPRICTVTPVPPEIAITFARTKFARTSVATRLSLAASVELWFAVPVGSTRLRFKTASDSLACSTRLEVTESVDALTS